MRKNRNLSEATKQKISNSLKGSKNPNFGKPLSPRHKDKIRQSMIKYWETIK
ncbi:NUMOD3 domain-containing DNA-binding protein [Dysgonomonas sp. 520]|uniref:NUMOD3 domain-containing DNA-binding protein n=1 Tax=Dysgonomonas sp. 520 TaxID=2302931 RepID=UPI0013D4A3BC|nr:hypothetical protein [Dysgonomonas sp. 520]